MAFLNRTQCTVLTLLLALTLVSFARAHAQENLQLIEQDIKGGLLYNFLKYTQWPGDKTSASDGTIAVCLFGGDPFNGRLDPMAGRTVNQRTIRLRTVNTLEGAEGCALLFVDPEKKAIWPNLHQALAGKEVLTVSDFQGFAESGGMIEFTRLDNRIGVKINTDAVAGAHLRVQDHLLRLANTVQANRTGK